MERIYLRKIKYTTLKHTAPHCGAPISWWWTGSPFVSEVHGRCRWMAVGRGQLVLFNGGAGVHTLLPFASTPSLPASDYLSVPLVPRKSFQRNPTSSSVICKEIAVVVIVPWKCIHPNPARRPAQNINQNSESASSSCVWTMKVRHTDHSNWPRYPSLSPLLSAVSSSKVQSPRVVK